VTIRLVVADDQSVVRDGLVLLLSTDPGIEVVGVARDGREAVDLSVRTRPDVLLCDLRMPVLDGAQVTAALAEQLPATRVLILTTFADDDAVLPALRAGAAGYLTKDTTGEDLVEAVRAVAAGRTVLDPAVQQRLVELLRAPMTPTPTPVPVAPVAEQAVGELPEGLTRREVDVVRLVSEGLSNQQIARRLVVSEATVKTHLNHVLSKLDVDGRAGLVAWAWRHGIVE
jgi:DNA-binding NarL/FixJ family response regulator